MSLDIDGLVQSSKAVWNTGMSPQSWSLLGFSRDRSLMSLLGGCWKEKKASLDSDGLVQSSVTEPNTGVNPQTGEIAS